MNILKSKCSLWFISHIYSPVNICKHIIMKFGNENSQHMYFRCFFVKNIYYNNCIIISQTYCYFLRMYHHIEFIDMASCQCVFSDVLIRWYSVRKHCHNGCIDMASPQCASSYDLLEHKYMITCSQNDHIVRLSPCACVQIVCNMTIL